MDNILHKWIKYPALTDVSETISFKFLIETILYCSFEFSIHSTHIEIIL